jgi:hypothetical protein
MTTDPAARAGCSFRRSQVRGLPIVRIADRSLRLCLTKRPATADFMCLSSVQSQLDAQRRTAPNFKRTAARTSTRPARAAGRAVRVGADGASWRAALSARRWRPVRSSERGVWRRRVSARALMRMRRLRRARRPSESSWAAGRRVQVPEGLAPGWGPRKGVKETGGRGTEGEEAARSARARPAMRGGPVACTRDWPGFARRLDARSSPRPGRTA